MTTNPSVNPRAEGLPPLCDNPSGMYCPDCRSTGLSHCSDPIHCGGMKPMRHGERDAASGRQGTCEHCDGTGIEPVETSEYPPEPCSVCKAATPPQQGVGTLDDLKALRAKFELWWKTVKLVKGVPRSTRRAMETSAWMGYQEAQPSATPVQGEGKVATSPLGFWEYLETAKEEVRRWPGWMKGELPEPLPGQGEVRRLDEVEIRKALSSVQIDQQSTRSGSYTVPIWPKLVNDIIRALAASSKSEVCKRCKANLCSHGRCTDWTCADACAHDTVVPDAGEVRRL